MKSHLMVKFTALVMGAMVLTCGGKALADLDGFSVASSTFAEQYLGNQMFDGTVAVAPWVLTGGGLATDYALNGTNLQLV